MVHYLERQLILQRLDAQVIGMFLIYFVTGYFLYAMMYAAAGAVVSKTEDLQGVILPGIDFNNGRILYKY